MSLKWRQANVCCTPPQVSSARYTLKTNSHTIQTIYTHRVLSWLCIYLSVYSHSLNNGLLHYTTLINIVNTYTYIHRILYCPQKQNTTGTEISYYKINYYGTRNPYDIDIISLLGMPISVISVHNWFIPSHKIQFMNINELESINHTPIEWY